MQVNVYRVLNEIKNDTDDASYTRHYNMLGCMITSPLLFLSAVVNVIAGCWILYLPLADIMINSAVLVALGICFEVFIRTGVKNLPNAMHIISILCSLTLIFFVIRFYSVFGPSLWVLGFMQVCYSMGQLTRTMLKYIMGSLFLCTLYVTLVKPVPMHEELYDISLFIFFALALLMTTLVYKVNESRNSRILHQYDDLKAAEEANKRLSLYDQLTGLPNRILFYEKLSESLLSAKRSNSKIYVLFVDIDMFKMVNDTMGHKIGDELLKCVSGRFLKIFGSNDMIARIGGDEFLVMLQGEKSERELKNTVDHILRAVREPFTINHSKLSVTCSVGISEYPADGDDVETLIRCADLALYKAKEEGKNRYAYCSENLKLAVQNEMDMITAMQDALEKEEFELYYQPQMNSDSNVVIGFEALIRWNHPELGLLLPKDFIPIAEKSGLIVPIGAWVLKTACRQNKEWQDKGTANVPVAVNVSSSQIFNNSFASELAEVLHETGLEPGFLQIEITERILVNEIDMAKQVINDIKKLGVKIAIDDFGTGYSSINYLKQFPIDLIKIPIEFVRGIDKNIKDESIISFILSLADNLNMRVIAEGVETERQLQFLQSILCNGIQGFYFSKPIEASRIEDYCGNLAGNVLV